MTASWHLDKLKGVTLRLNLGAGAHPLPGYVNIDRAYSAGVSGAHGETRGGEVYPLPYPDESVTEVRASHVLEHFPFRQTAEVLAEWVRVLKPGGVLKVAVPNFVWIAEKYLAGEEINTLGYVCGGQVDENDYHEAIFDEEDLRAYFKALGLVAIQHWVSEIEDCAALPVSLNLMGFKPDEGYISNPPSPLDEERRLQALAALHVRPDQVAQPEGSEGHLITLPAGAVKAVMSMPRLAFTDNCFCLVNALGPLGIQVSRHNGVFWEQGLSELMEVAVSEGARYVLTLDYDTVFTQREVRELVRIMETRPEIDALCAVQMRRDHPFALMTMEDGQGGCRSQVSITELEAEAIAIRTGHFGLTLIRAESLGRAKRPWFMPHPDPDGGWDERKIDSDIHFWLNWKGSGLTLYMANRAVVGHLEYMVTWPGKDLKPVHQYTSDWHKQGKPLRALR